MRRLKRYLFILLLLLIAFIVYVEVVNRNSSNMTYRQKILKAVYPALMWVSKISGSKSRSMDNTTKVKPNTAIYNLKVKLNNGDELPLETLRGKKILIVNTASNCGYTSQYEDLQTLFNENKDRLMIIAFPANDFKDQEKGNDEEIAAFCKVNFGISFPLATKSTVIKSDAQNEVFKWLSDASKNGWNDQAPTWNFSKYLIDEEGRLVNYFDRAVSPISPEIKTAIAK